MKLTKLASAVLAFSLLVPLGASAQQAMVKGEVKKVDAAGGKITLTSGPIKNLDMEDDNMTMALRVQDAAMLKQVKPGDKVQFEAEKASAGLTITKLEKAK
jgi:Cu/Ag efflux protein CusF